MEEHKWFCYSCQKGGSVTCESGKLGSVIARKIAEAHDKASPECLSPDWRV